jgi:hypothetical protein
LAVIVAMIAWREGNSAKHLAGMDNAVVARAAEIKVLFTYASWRGGDDGTRGRAVTYASIKDS